MIEYLRTGANTHADGTNQTYGIPGFECSLSPELIALSTRMRNLGGDLLTILESDTIIVSTDRNNENSLYLAVVVAIAVSKLHTCVEPMRSTCGSWCRGDLVCKQEHEERSTTPIPNSPNLWNQYKQLRTKNNFSLWSARKKFLAWVICERLHFVIKSL